MTRAPTVVQQVKYLFKAKAKMISMTMNYLHFSIIRQRLLSTFCQNFTLNISSQECFKWFNSIVAIGVHQHLSSSVIRSIDLKLPEVIRNSIEIKTTRCIKTRVDKESLLFSYNVQIRFIVRGITDVKCISRRSRIFTPEDKTQI